MNRALSAVFVLFAAGALTAMGCGEPALDPAVLAQHRSRLTLADEPDGAQTVLEVRNVMFGEEPAAEEHEHADHEHADEDEGHAHDDHEHEGDADHAAAHAEDAGDDVEEGEQASADHDEADHEQSDHEHADHEHGDEDHADHDHEHAEAPAKMPVISEMDVVLVGAVGGVPNPSEQSHPEFPFAKGKAVFFLADPEAVAEVEEHEHKHAPGEECSFCAAHAGDSAHMLAVVQFADEKGKPLPVDARELFELQEKETVVVRGKAKIDPSGMLVVDATGLYVRR
jgi:hypothetical protein